MKLDTQPQVRLWFSLAQEPPVGWLVVLPVRQQIGQVGGEDLGQPVRWPLIAHSSRTTDSDAASARMPLLFDVEARRIPSYSLPAHASRVP